MRHLILFLSIIAATAGTSFAEEKPYKKTPYERPLLVELFTSQGCASCPEADRLIAQYTYNDSLLPLSYHVDYWDNLGWKDPFSSKFFTKRQELYITKHNGGTVFTPHVVIDGIRSVTGTNTDMMNVDIVNARMKSVTIPITIKKDTAGKNFVVKIYGEQDGMDIEKLPKNAEIYRVVYTPMTHTKIETGPNMGQTLPSANVVRDIEYVGEWAGKTAFFRIPVEKVKEEGLAIFLQEPDMGHIYGVAAYNNNAE